MGAITLAIGVLTILVAFYGIICSFIRKLVLLKFYLFTLCIILAFGLSIGIIGLSYASQSPSKVSQVINFKYFNESENRDTIDRIQFTVNLKEILLYTTRSIMFIYFKYGCCGINLPSDWQIFLAQTNLPSSCCLIQNQNPCIEYVTYNENH
jgi:hypothetical protein